MDWSWIGENSDLVLTALFEHIYLAVIPVVLGLFLALALGAIAHRHRWLYPPLLAGAGVLYTLPSLALFIALPVVLGTQILDPVNIIVALTLYTTALLVRTVVDGLDSVPHAVRQTAAGMGYGRMASMLTVELPIAVPVIAAGLRVATVANISMVSVGALIGIGGLGELFIAGFQIRVPTEIVVGLVLSVALATTADRIVVLLQRVLTPWKRAEGRA